jgi:taurine dioxygenase
MIEAVPAPLGQFSNAYEDGMDTPITLKRLTGAIGAEVKGINLKQPLRDRTFATIHQAFLDNCVLIFRGQFLDPTEQMAFAHRWGEVLDAPYLKPTEMPGKPGLLVVPNLGKERSYTTEVWHTDLSFMAAPPALTMLAAQVVPEVGGDTMFASQYRAYETLSEGMKRILETLRALHGGGKLAGLFGIEDSAPRQSHPIVRTHPESNRKALYVNPLYTQLIEGLTEAECRGLLDFLFQHVCRPDFTYRHQWAHGDVVMWDNRCALHYAVHDHGDAPRVMYRTVIAGDTPR